MKKIIAVGLGCPKNQVDLEIMLKRLTDEGFELVDEAWNADIALVNTCAFIEDAKQEAIDSILEMADYKADGSLKAIIVTGCLAERYREEIFTEIPEVDAVLGIGANEDIITACYAVLDGKKIKSFPEKERLPLEGERLVTTPAYWAYLRISDGCSNNCTYCAIPSIRGAFRSCPKQSIIDQARTLAASGVKELVIIAQDTTRYGLDLYGKLALPELLEELCGVEGIEWIRLLYCYPDYITDELLDVIAAQDKIQKYLDIPLQHANGKVLAAMNRRGDEATLLELIGKIRERVPGIALRTTLMAGFPGEGEAEFEALCEFVNKARFDNLGCFAYSREEGTAAYDLDEQVEPEVAQSRRDTIMEQQARIAAELNKERIGSTLQVICEGYNKYTDSYYGRAYCNAPEIDGLVLFTCGYHIDDGDIIPVEIFSVSEEGYDLIGEAV